MLVLQSKMGLSPWLSKYAPDYIDAQSSLYMLAPTRSMNFSPGESVRPEPSVLQTSNIENPRTPRGIQEGRGTLITANNALIWLAEISDY